MDVNDRLKQLIENKGITAYELSLKSGVPHSSLSRILNGETKKIGSRNKELLSKYFNVDENYFNNGNKTEVFQESLIASEPEVNYENSGVPYYDVDFVGGFDVVMNNQKTKPAFYINFPQFNDADCWVNITGKSMSPFISHGDIVALKQVHSWKDFIPFGEIYAIVTDEFRTVKILKKGPDKETFILKPYSKDDSFSEQEIPTRLIRAVFTVRGAMKRFF